MSDVIQCDHNALETVQLKFNQHSEAIGEMLQKIHRVMDPLEHGGWIGRGSVAFFAEMNDEVLPAIHRLREALALAQETTREIGTVFKGADEEASSPFSSGGLVVHQPIGVFPTPPLGNQWSVPNDWLDDVTDFIQDYGQGNQNRGIPQNWLGDVVNAFQNPSMSEAGTSDTVLGSDGTSDELTGAASGSGAGGASGEASGGGSGGASGGGSGGGTGGGSSEPSTASSQPVGTNQSNSGLGGGSGIESTQLPETEIHSPYSSASGFYGNNFSTGYTSAEVGSTPQQGYLPYQSNDYFSAGAGVPAGAGGTVAQSLQGGGSSEMPQDVSQSSMSMGLLAASPLVALLGKTIKQKMQGD